MLELPLVVPLALDMAEPREVLALNMPDEETPDDAPPPDDVAVDASVADDPEGITAEVDNPSPAAAPGGAASLQAAAPTPQAATRTGSRMARCFIG